MPTGLSPVSSVTRLAVPYRRFTRHLTVSGARLGVKVVALPSFLRDFHSLHLHQLYQRAHELILFWDAKLFHSGSNLGTPWHLKKGLDHVLVGISLTHPNGEAIASLGISLPDVNMPAEIGDRLGALLAHTASGISAKLAKI